MLEDDVNKYREFPEYLDIPDDTDLLYMGISKWGSNNIDGGIDKVYTKSVDNYPDIVRVYNMLSTHGMIICSIMGVLALQKAMFDAYYKNCHWDLLLAQIQPYYKMYAFIVPLVYQDSKVGGEEAATKITLSLDYLNQQIPEKYLNTYNPSVITCHLVKN